VTGAIPLIVTPEVAVGLEIVGPTEPVDEDEPEGCTLETLT